VGNHGQRPVIVAMVAMRVMQAPADEIIDMVAMRHRLVAAVGPVTVRSIVTRGVVLGIAAIRIRVAHGDRMLLRPAALAMLKMAVVEVIDVAFMLDGEMAAVRAVHMRLDGGWHCYILSSPSPVRFNNLDYGERRRRRKRGIPRRSGRIFLRNETRRAAFHCPLQMGVGCGGGAGWSLLY
jgi:hypothetical protein